MAPLKILISGGGVAGIALAFWLSKLNHEVTVVERSSTLRTTGLQIDLRGHGVEVLKRMGLDKVFRSKSVPEQGLQLVDSSGRRRAYFRMNDSGKGVQSFTTEYEIMRGDLCRLLFDGCQDRVNFVFGTSIQSFENRANCVEVRFANGTTENYDLLAGADGSGSGIRKMMLGPNNADGFRSFGGLAVAYFTVPLPQLVTEESIATMYLASRKRQIMTRRAHPDKLQVYLGCAAGSNQLTDVRPGNVKKETEVFADLYKGAGWQADSLISSMMDSDDFYCERMGFVKLDNWSKGRVVLVGDAAYCPSAKTGMGTTSAIVGAYILAGEIGRRCGGDRGDRGSEHDLECLREALQAYERTFRPFMDQVIRGISESDSWDSMPSTSFGIGVVHLLAGLASLLKVNVGRWMLKEEIKDWNLPEYQELK